MTDKEKLQIKKLREKGVGYKKIAAMTGIKINSIKTYCRRHCKEVELPKPKAEGLCPNCGKEVIKIANRKPRRFCCDDCRKIYWKMHPEELKQGANYEFTCKHCNKPFIAYGNNHRLYCSHECYIIERFGDKA